MKEIDLIFEDIAIPTDVIFEPEKWFNRPHEEKISILNDISEFLYGDPNDDLGIFNIDLNDPEAIG